MNGDSLRNELDLQASAVALIDADGSNFRILTDIPGEIDSHPAWSPDGPQILFISSDDSQLKMLWNVLALDLFIINVDGTGRRRFTNTPLVVEADPYWGLNGWVTFLRAPLLDVLRGEPAQVYIMDENGEDLTQVSHVEPGGRTLIGFSTGPYDPVWDAAGERLAWSLVPSELRGLARIGDFDLIIVDPFGQECEISPNPYPDVMPRWSPDGRRLAFWTLFGHDNGEWVFWDIYTITPDGRRRTNLTRDLADDASMPDWFPEGRIIFTSVKQQGG